LKQRDLLAEEGRRQATEVDFLQFQFDELIAARLIPDEKEQLEAELETLVHAEEIKTKLHQVSEGLNQGESTSVSQLRSMLALVRQVTALYPVVSLSESRLGACIIELDDVGDELTALAEKITHDPERIMLVQERLDILYRLEHKHHVNSSAALCEVRDTLGSKLAAIQTGGENLEQAERELTEARVQLHELAKALSESRVNAFSHFTEQVLSHLGSIGMTTARLKIDHQLLAEPNDTGTDRIVFLFNANPDGELRPIAKVASGGELSRLMLAVKATLSARSLVGTIIFDEIDSGVSGDIAARLGTMMRRMGEGAQLIAITHLPQIAAKASSHYKVSKLNINGETRSEITQLNEQQRVEELAGMLGGATPSAEARATAKQLMG